ncbi:MAG: gamma-glutamyltransferase [Bacteroidia bacterium]|nr:gamma-glutamyltransferase [Bacteroidia bacterium]
MRPWLLMIPAICLCFFSCRKVKQAQRGLIADHAMVVSAHPEASRVGIEILKKGGNAIDAAVAVQFALAVTYPRAGNIGGGGFMLARMADGRTYALDFREKAPSRADRDMYLDSTGQVIKDLSWLGHLAVGVPGTVAGAKAAHDSLGKLSWPEVVEPAIRLAEGGFALTAKGAKSYKGKQDKFLGYNTRPNIFAVQKDWKEGDRIIQKDLARSLKSIQDEGEKAFYQGWIADSLVAEMERGGGLISHEDLLAYEAVWRKPVRGLYRGHEIISMPPPSSGGIALLQMLEMVENFPLGEYSYKGAKMVHLMVEAERRVYADRSKHLGDPDFYAVPREGLLTEAYLKERMADFNPDQATPSDLVEAGNPTKESEQTTHFSIVDSMGNAVSITTTLNGSYGSCVIAGGTGFFLNNEMDDFSSKPGVPNFYGLLGSEANSIVAGKRMLSSMTPTIVTKNDSLLMVVGTPGGSTIITSVFQNIVNVIDFGLPMQASVAEGRFHHQWKPDTIRIDTAALHPRVINKLEEMGHVVKPRSPIGRVDAILVLPDGRLEGGADPRGDDKSMGF